MKNELKLSSQEQDAAISSFCDSIRINTVSGIGPDGGYQAFVDFLMEELPCKCWVLPESLEGKPILVSTIEGSAREAQILLNAHYDVVPVMQEDWTVPAFDAVRKEGRIYGRGTQDIMRFDGVCVCCEEALAGGFRITTQST